MTFQLAQYTPWRPFVFGGVVGLSLLGCRQELSPPEPSATVNHGDQAETAETQRADDKARAIPFPPLPWKSLPDEANVISRVAFGSCSMQYREQPLWDVLQQAEPDLFLHLGDLIYADLLPYGAHSIPAELDVVKKAAVDYAFLSAHTGFVSFIEKVPFLSVWDDHDLGQNDAGATFPRRAEMEELYLEFVGAGPQDPRRSRPGLYVAYTFGPPQKRLQIILVDTRSFRDDLLSDPRSPEEKKAAGVIGAYTPHQDPGKTLLGTRQWAWLQKELEKPADVRLVASSIQVIASEKGTESWGNFPHERQRLYDLIAQTHASGVVLLSGDVHFAELSRTEDGPYPLYDFTSSNLAQHETSWGERVVNNYRVAGPYSRVNFGQIDIDWEKRVLKLTIRDKDGVVVLEHDLPLAELHVQ